MSRHTPGPWKCWQLSVDEGSNYWRIRTTNDGAALDTLRGYCGEANARLVAAAPELLEVCKKAAALIEETKFGGLVTAQALAAAIEKAEGAKA